MHASKKSSVLAKRRTKRESERARVTFAVSLARSAVVDLPSSVVYVRFTNGEA